jgi:predicted RNA-binding protein with PIN domain
MRALVVDAYNLIHAQPRLAAMIEGNREAAREELASELMPLAGPDHYELVMLVFDAAGSPQSEPVIEDRGGLVIVYTRRGQTADSFIETAVKYLVAEGAVTVATNDRALRDVSTGFGARALDAEAIFSAAREAQEDMRRELGRMQSENRSRLEDRVGEEIRHILDTMRYG